MLAVGAGRHRRLGELRRQPGARRLGALRAIEQRRQRRPDLEHHAGVDNVLGRRPPVHVGPVLTAALRERPDHGHERML